MSKLSLTFITDHANRSKNGNLPAPAYETEYFYGIVLPQLVRTAQEGKRNCHFDVPFMGISPAIVAELITKYTDCTVERQFNHIDCKWKSF